MPDTFLFPLQDHVGEALHDEAGRTSDLTPQRQVMAPNISSSDQKPFGSLHTVLMGSTSIPSLGMTFEVALTELRRLDSLSEGSDNSDVSGTALDSGDRIIAAMLSSKPQTAADARAILDLLTDDANGIGENGVGERDVAALRNVTALLSSLQGAAELSPALVTAYWEWHRADAVYDLIGPMEAATEEGGLECEALGMFAEATAQAQYRLWDAFHCTPSATVADRLFKVRVILDKEGEDAIGGVRDDALQGLAEVARMVPYPPPLEAPANPETDDERRAFLTARPEEIPNAAPADLLRLFTPEQGAEVFALLASYAQAKRSNGSGALPRALLGLDAYGRYAAKAGMPFAREDEYTAGAVLTPKERVDLARLGYLHARAAKRLNAARKRFEARHEAQEQRRKAEAEAERTKRDRERHGPPLSEQLRDLLPELSSEASEHAESLILAARMVAAAHAMAADHASRLGAHERAALRMLDLPPLYPTLNAETQEAVRQVLTTPTEADDAELLELWRQYLPLKAAANDLEDTDAPFTEVEAFNRKHEVLENRIASIPARSAIGLAVKLGVLWLWGGARVDKPERHAGPNRLSGWCERWLWMIVNEARALGGPMQILPDEAATDIHMAAALSRGLVSPGEDCTPVAYAFPSAPFSNPDAELLALGNEMTALIDLVYRNLDDDGLERLTDRLVQIDSRIAEIVPTTPEGAAIKLRAIWNLFTEDPDEHRYGAQPKTELRKKAIWNLIGEVKQMGGVRATASANPDPFSDTLLAFQDEAEKALCLPTAPTVDMLEAGAAAAGIDIEQARAIYAAMADAYKKEAA
ncbi:hypothetical protein [Azospirillum argentinense]|uniref:hypothetical protein n=1 Tax=Azospirillum argentinense TaxID=2970906 RepID=UPI0032DF987D